MSSICRAELDAKFLAEEQALDARARALVLRRADRATALRPPIPCREPSPLALPPSKFARALRGRQAD
jgi:hypothetical protein